MKRGGEREEKNKREQERRGRGKKLGERQKRVGVWWREITRVFVVVCWSSPGYKPFIASVL